jgi:hypothetical protein
MPQSRSGNFVRAYLLTACLSLSFSSSALADVVAPISQVPPASSVYVVPDTCISVICLENIQFAGFNTNSRSIQGGNEVTSSDVNLTGNIYQNVGGMPGMFISPLLLTGDVDITYFAKTTLSGTGDFSSQITSLDLSGSFKGLTGKHTLEAMLNPNQPSNGEISVDQISYAPAEFQFSGYFDVYVEYSVDGGAFVQGPERVATLGETPEPSYYVPIGIGFALILMRRVTRARRLAAGHAAS